MAATRKPRTLRAPAKPIKTTVYYERTGNKPFSEDEIQVIAPALVEIAERHAVDGVRNLSPRKVFEEVYNDPTHVLRRFYDFTDVEGAAKKYWIERSRQLISSVTVVIVRGNAAPVRAPAFVFSETSVRTNTGTVTKRRHVLTSDLIEHDPQFMSAIAYNIKRIHDALAYLEKVTSCREPPAGVEALIATLRSALDDYRRVLDAAA